MFGGLEISINLLSWIGKKKTVPDESVYANFKLTSLKHTVFIIICLYSCQTPMASTDKFEAPECSLYINYVFFVSAGDFYCSF